MGHLALQDLETFVQLKRFISHKNYISIIYLPCLIR